MLFNRTPLVVGKSIQEPEQDIIRTTPQLVNASLDDALKYGGDLSKAALNAMALRHDRRHVIVDTKVHMLMPGFFPCIPGWHTDGVPRGPTLNPLAKARPSLSAQESISQGYVPGLRPTHYHMLVTGNCRTLFMTNPTEMDLPNDETMYTVMDELMTGSVAGVATRVAPPSGVLEFDWWSIHRGAQATRHEWRYFIRVAETDLAEPERDLRKVIRTQSQVYMPAGSFSW